MYLRDKHISNDSIVLQKFGRHRLKMNTTKTILYLIANLISAITIILLNKWIYSHEIFPNVSLTMLHFVVTFLVLCVCEKLNFFSVKSAELKQLIILSLCFCGFVVFTNLSLEYNSVGSFQIAKVLTTPGVMIIQTIFKGKHFPHPVKLTTIPIVVGAIVCFFYDIHFNLIGTFYAVLGVVVTSLYQVLVNSKQSEMQLDSMQLLYYQAPLSAFFLCLCIPFVEPQVLSSFTRHWTFLEVFFVIVSCSAAILVNLTTYWILGNTSPLTYNMVGHLKFILITLGGWYLFQHTMLVNQWLGICITLSGLIVYTHLKIKEQQVQIPSFKEGEIK